jgi:transposase
LLRALGFSCQRPAKRALQRDEAAIRQWRTKRWPALKKTPEPAAKPSSS